MPVRRYRYSQSRRNSSPVKAEESATIAFRTRAQAIHCDVDRKTQERHLCKSLSALLEHREGLRIAELGQDLDCGRTHIGVALLHKQGAELTARCFTREVARQLAPQDAHIGAGGAQ